MSSSVFFSGGRGPVSFRAVKGKGGPVSFGVGCETVRHRRHRRRRRRRCRFLFWGGRGASQLPGCEGEGVSFRAVKGEGGPVSFGVGCETVRRRRRRRAGGGAGGQSASGL